MAEWVLRCIKSAKASKKEKFKIPKFRIGYGFDTQNKLSISLWISSVRCKTPKGMIGTVRELESRATDFMSDLTVKY